MLHALIYSICPSDDVTTDMVEYSSWLDSIPFSLCVRFSTIGRHVIFFVRRPRQIRYRLGACGGPVVERDRPMAAARSLSSAQSHGQSKRSPHTPSALTANAFYLVHKKNPKNVLRTSPAVTYPRVTRFSNPRKAENRSALREQGN